MNKLQNFDFQGKELRIIEKDDDIWFAMPDIAKALELSNSTMAIKSLDGDEVTKFNLGGLSGKTNFISEPGLYKLIGASRKPEAKVFNRWVTHEVLPTIRKYGGYLTDEKLEEALLNPDTIIQLATQLKQERSGRLIAEQQVNELKPKADYVDRVLSNDSLVSISIIAKDYGMSGSAFNKLLHDFGVQYRQGKTWLLYSKYQRTGWTQSETHMVQRKDGTEKAVLNTKWTQKGHLGLYELLKKHDVHPLIERLDID